MSESDDEPSTDFILYNVFIIVIKFAAHSCKKMINDVDKYKQTKEKNKNWEKQKEIIVFRNAPHK